MSLAMPIRTSTWNTWFYCSLFTAQPLWVPWCPFCFGWSTYHRRSSNFAHQGCNCGLLPERFSPFRTIGVTFFFAVGKIKENKTFWLPSPNISGNSTTQAIESASKDHTTVVQNMLDNKAGANGSKRRFSRAMQLFFVTTIYVFFRWILMLTVHSCPFPA